jgi:hypothetical protein
MTLENLLDTRGSTFRGEETELPDAQWTVNQDWGNQRSGRMAARKVRILSCGKTQKYKTNSAKPCVIKGLHFQEHGLKGAERSVF